MGGYKVSQVRLRGAIDSSMKNDVRLHGSTGDNMCIEVKLYFAVV